MTPERTSHAAVAADLVNSHQMKLGDSFSGALRTFGYFMASGTMNTLEGVDYLSLYGKEPSAIEQVFAIYANVIEVDTRGTVVNGKYAEKRSTDYLRAYFDPEFVVEPPYQEWRSRFTCLRR
jgi:hypothetical protein